MNTIKMLATCLVASVVTTTCLPALAIKPAVSTSKIRASQGIKNAKANKLSAKDKMAPAVSLKKGK